MIQKSIRYLMQGYEWTDLNTIVNRDSYLKLIIGSYMYLYAW